MTAYSTWVFFTFMPGSDVVLSLLGLPGPLLVGFALLSFPELKTSLIPSSFSPSLFALGSWGAPSVIPLAFSSTKEGLSLISVRGEKLEHDSVLAILTESKQLKEKQKENTNLPP